ncbi:hypothetical protein [Sorangium sp. So ce233]
MRADLVDLGERGARPGEAPGVVPRRRASHGPATTPRAGGSTVET